MTMPWSTQDAEQDALELTDIGTERLLRSLYELESPFFVHLVIEAALLSARVTAYGILVQPQPGFDGEEVNDFVLQRDQLDIDAVVRLEALLAFQHLLLFSGHPDNRSALIALMEWPADDPRLEERLTAVYRRAIFASLDDSFDWESLDDIADSWRRDQARQDGPIHPSQRPSGPFDPGDTADRPHGDDHVSGELRDDHRGATGRVPRRDDPPLGRLGRIVDGPLGTVRRPTRCCPRFRGFACEEGDN